MLLSNNFNSNVVNVNWWALSERIAVKYSFCISEQKKKKKISQNNYFLIWYAKHQLVPGKHQEVLAEHCEDEMASILN